MPPSRRPRSAAARAVHRSEVIEVPGDALDVAVVADTHGQPHPNAPELIRKLSPALILHAGDIGAPSALDPLRAIAPLLAVRGNIDGAVAGFADSLDIELCAGARRLLKLLLIHIAVYGPRLRAEVARLALEHDARIVLCGHSHVPFLGRDRGLVMFNPGSIGPRRFQLPITFGVLAIRPSGISLRHVSCETGETWLP
ncbi:MAG TPA: metallophosphoesterase family protein [Polyangiaceae bacterium]|nr:metallophosphoesterase family protein [Polyangiaceae bacterium]